MHVVNVVTARGVNRDMLACWHVGMLACLCEEMEPVHGALLLDMGCLMVVMQQRADLCVSCRTN